MFGIQAEQAGEVITQLRVVEPLSLHAEQYQCAKQRLGAWLAKAQRTGALAVKLQWARHLIESLFADGAIVRDGLDVKQASVGLEARYCEARAGCAGTQMSDPGVYCLRSNALLKILLGSVLILAAAKTILRKDGPRPTAKRDP